MSSHREILKANRRARQKRYFRRFATAATFSILILLYGGWYFWNSPSFALTRIVITGAKTIPVERLTQTVGDVLTGQYLGFFRQRVNWFYPRVALLEKLQRQFPELATIDVSNPSFGVLQVEVSERRPAALWCEVDCYYLDDTGLLYAPAPQFSNHPLFALSGFSLPIPIGSRPLAISDFRRLLDLRATINQLLQATPDFSDQTIVAVSLVEPADYAFNVRNVRLAPRGWKLLTARRDTVETTVSRLAATFSVPAFLTEYRLPAAILDSLDVRFDRKVFYKFM